MPMLMGEPSLTERSEDAITARMKVTIRGAVQGVGFRPFVYRLARQIQLAGSVRNTSQGVSIEVEGPEASLREFLVRLQHEKPAIASIHSLESQFLDPVGLAGFDIAPSEDGQKRAIVLPDIATCPDCLREIFDPQNRRYRYPFTNCTNCGPRFTIVEALPYDRPNTSMRKFQMCPECRREYYDPTDRRFHAQPNACAACGPHLELWNPQGVVISSRDAALLQAVEAIQSGAIVAVKGIGGFHLLVDATNAAAINRLRERKHRDEKPFALMFPSLASVREFCRVDELEERLLLSAESPIVLLRKQPRCRLPEQIAPGNPYLGAMLPYSPIHHLLMREVGSPVVATSGNLSDEPICTDENEALRRLAEIADVFLVHDRPIVRHVDDSVARVLLGREQLLRRARGYAPLPISLKGNCSPALAVGAHQKNTIALAIGDQAFVSQHLGDLDTLESRSAFEAVIASFEQLYGAPEPTIICDLHPDYASTNYAQSRSQAPFQVQHHYAHALSCMLENQLDAPALAVTWDGSGFGTDGTVWGGEFLQIDKNSFRRTAHLRTFPLIGNEKAVREPRRSALGMLYEMSGDAVFEDRLLSPSCSLSERERQLFPRMVASRINTPRTSSAGRLFDAVAALLDIRQRCSFEGQAAMELEFLATEGTSSEAYDCRLKSADDIEVDWEPMIRGILNELAGGAAKPEIARKFHNTLAEMIAAVSKAVGLEAVVLTGGCFQNRLLTELAVARLCREGFQPYWHHRIPPNDGGITPGQIAAMFRNERAGT